MPSDFDETDFVDSDFQASKPASYSAGTPTSASSGLNRPPSREELHQQVSETQQRLTELKRVQEELERKRAALEDERRRQTEFQTGRQEMLQHLTRGAGLLEEAEFAARRDAEQMAKSLAGLREALGKVQAIHEEHWTQESYQNDLSRALTTLENARLEWNSARLKWPILSGGTAAGNQNDDATKRSGAGSWFAGKSFGELCKLGLALTWPLALVAVLALTVFLVALLRK
ncbi:MAG: hypothetical protein HY043_22950 [Verrucomicrobia bacterium]|nr:hypothetical protein [Verrucomicrobiota bacterium]